MEFKINIGDPKSSKTVQKVVSGDHAQALLKKKIGEKVSGDSIGFPGYEFEITGGSDYCGFPMRRDVRGSARKKVLIVSGVGIRKNRRGRKVRKTVAGNAIYSKTAQINLKVLKQGEKPLVEEKAEAAKEAKAEEKKPEAKEEKKEEKKAEAKEEKAAEKKEEKAKAKEEKKEEAKEEKKAAEKKEEKEEKKAEAKGDKAAEKKAE